MIQPMLLAFSGRDKGTGAMTPASRKVKAQMDALGLTRASGYYYGNARMGAFLPGLKKLTSKVSKYTRPLTTAVAKSFLPSGVVDMIATLDPTKKGGAKGATAVQQTAALISQNLGPVAPNSAPATVQNPTGSIEKQAALDTLKNPLFLGVAGVGAAVILIMAMKKR